MSHPRILYCAFGRAGHLVFRKLMTEISAPPANVLSFTYDHDDNQELLTALHEYSVPYHTMRLKGDKALAVVIDFAPDVIISMHYRDLIPGSVLNVAPMGGFNLHPSLLPRYRGTFSAPWVIINGERKTGITFHYMNEKFDDGRIILQQEVEITPHETAYMLFHRLIDAAVFHFNTAYDRVVNQRFMGDMQVGEPSYYPRQVPHEGLIDPSWSLEQIDRYIRAMYFPPKPPAQININGKRHNILDIAQYKELMGLE